VALLTSIVIFVFVIESFAEKERTIYPTVACLLVYMLDDEIVGADMKC
jgi:hypothetical protein